MECIPQFGRHKHILAIDKAFLNSAFDSQARLSFITIIVCPVEKSVSSFDGLVICQSRYENNNFELLLLTW